MSARRLLALSAALAAACTGSAEPGVPLSIAADPTSVTMTMGTSVGVGAVVTGGGAGTRLEWRSLTPGIAVVDPVTAGGARVVAVAPGAGAIVVSVAGRPDVADTVRVSVMGAPCPIPGPSVTPSQVTIAVGDTVRLRTVFVMCGVPAGADMSPLWLSLQPDVANVDSFGLVSGLAPGIATIRVAPRSAPNVVGTATVTVR